MSVWGNAFHNGVVLETVESAEEMRFIINGPNSFIFLNERQEGKKIKLMDP